MSWDVVLIRTESNKEPLDMIESENIIPFTREEITQELAKTAASFGADCDCENPAWQTMYGNGWSIEFCADEGDESESVMLLIRGNTEPAEVLKAFAEALGARLVDCGTGEFMDFDRPSGFEAWRAYRDKIINYDGQ